MKNVHSCKAKLVVVAANSPSSSTPYAYGCMMHAVLAKTLGHHLSGNHLSPLLCYHAKVGTTWTNNNNG